MIGYHERGSRISYTTWKAALDRLEAWFAKTNEDIIAKAKRDFPDATDEEIYVALSLAWHKTTRGLREGPTHHL